MNDSRSASRAGPWRLAAAAPAGIVAAAAPTGRTPEALLRPAGPQARLVAGALTFDLWFVLALFVVVAAIAVYAVWRARTSSRRRAGALPPQVAGDRRLEVGWTVTLIVTAVVLLAHPVPAEFAFDRTPAAHPITVDVTGHQFWWAFRYPAQGVVTANEMHIPSGRVIQLHVTSADVIHAFAIPSLGGHDWAIPGRVTTVWIKADRPGVYQGQCAELCGAGHADMLFRVIAQPPARYEAWLNAMRHPVVRPGTPAAVAGMHLFLKGEPCAACHTINGTPAHGTVGPNLTLLGDRTSLSGGVLPNDAQGLTAWLKDPAHIKPGTAMPDLHLSPTKIHDLVAFLEGLKH